MERAAYLAKLKADAEARRWAPDWEKREQERKHRRRALVRFHAAKRKAVMLQRTPAWADMKAIKAIYAKANEITRETGVPHVVDHIVPLQGRLVSGLHVAANMRVITAIENSRKRNAFD